MTFIPRIAGAAALGAAMLVGAGLSAPPAQTAYIVTLTQEGANVVANGSGTINLTDLTMFGEQFPFPPAIFPGGGTIFTGMTNAADIYTGFTGPESFGSGALTFATSGSGDFVGIGLSGELFVPFGYASGSALSDSAIYDDQTFASLSAIPGSYVWTWGSGATADRFTLQIGPVAVSEPSSLALLALPLALVMLLGAWCRKATPGSA